MIAVENVSSAAVDHDLAPYRAISRSAIISAVMAFVGIPLVILAVVSTRFQFGDAVPLGMMGAFIGGVALVLGLTGARTIHRYPAEYTGARLARFGLFCGLILVI